MLRKLLIGKRGLLATHKHKKINMLLEFRKQKNYLTLSEKTQNQDNGKLLSRTKRNLWFVSRSSHPVETPLSELKVILTLMSSQLSGLSVIMSTD